MVRVHSGLPFQVVAPFSTCDFPPVFVTRALCASRSTLYLGLGDRDRAFAAMEQAMPERSVILVLMDRDPMWDPIRSDPRFADLVRRSCGT
jgi:hypothetical protein